MPRWTMAAMLAVTGLAASGAGQPAPVRDLKPFVDQYCLDCHGVDRKKGDLSLEGLNYAKPADHPEIWERVVRKLRHRQMPPADESTPEEAENQQAIAFLTTELDRASALHPQPGRVDSLRRLNRTEYQNAVRDLLGVEIDAAALLPQDEPAHGFDNVMVNNLSPTLVERYVAVAQKVAGLALGTRGKAPDGFTVRVPPEITQDRHLEGLPPGTRGGVRISYQFPQDGDYDINVRLVRDRNEQVEGLVAPAEIEILLDRGREALFTVAPQAKGQDAENVDRHLTQRIPVKAGPHEVAVTFPEKNSGLFETVREPYVSRFNVFRHPRTAPAVYQVTITGPFDPRGPGDTPSRRRLLAPLATLPAGADDEARVRAVLTPLMHLAYRRPVTEADYRSPLKLFQEGRAEGSFDAGLERAVAGVLVNPQFLFRIERDPSDAKPGTVYAISDLELASRLAFFLWSSVPDEALLAVAERGELRQPAVLERQVLRMLADDRATNLATNFAAQWLHLRALEAVHPDQRLFVDFDDNLRQAMRAETELFFESVLREDRSVMDLLGADYTYLNERLARHYGIPHVIGSRFRRVSFASDPQRERGGLLRQGSLLTVTSYATRTSPVIRGKWILDNLLGTPPPPPPPDVPALDGVISETLPIRQRLAEHRKNPTCASCHKVMDPIGFSLEQFDAVGRFRKLENFHPVDASGGMPDGREFEGVAGLEQALLAQPDLFASTVTEKLFVFALGRAPGPYDAPAVRKIVEHAGANNYRLSSLILGLVQSTPFQQRTTP